jgi:antitoxin component of MazEF toxin-antitoxin module
MEARPLRTTLSPSRRGGAVRLPRDILERAGVKPGDSVDVTVERGRVVVTAVGESRQVTLGELLAQITDSTANSGPEAIGDRLAEWPTEADVADIVEIARRHGG